jgi:4-alpha-glucanotransferase
VPTLQERASGVLLHVTSLPGPHGNGDLGAEAHAFADVLARSGQRWWQMLPVGPTGYGDSPYSTMSAFAGNPLLVDLDALGVPVDRARFAADRVDYAAASAFREKHLRRAFQAEATRPARERSSFRAYCEQAAALAYLGRTQADLDAGLEIHWEMIRLAMSSVARTAIVPMQDVLGLGSEARMNTPGHAGGNWRWRLEPEAMTPALERRLLDCSRAYGRAPETKTP